LTLGGLSENAKAASIDSVQPASNPEFVHRPVDGPSGLLQSICSECGTPVAASRSEDILKLAEAVHHCLAEQLRIFREDGHAR